MMPLVHSEGKLEKSINYFHKMQIGPTENKWQKSGRISSIKLGCRLRDPGIMTDAVDTGPRRPGEREPALTSATKVLQQAGGI